MDRQLNLTFEEKYGSLTVEQAIRLNKIHKEDNGTTN